MGLSRLENFLRSVRGTIIYVDPNALDSTDSIENDGTSAARPFKTLQRALIESARFSYLPGFDNDKFGNTTILLYPGEHLIDNRPGWIPLTGSNFLKRDGTTSIDFNEFTLQTNFDINSDNNALFKFNSIHGGVIVPRGTSIVGYDLRKTKIRPKYVPNPTNDNIERSAIFRLTGACYIWQLSIFDANPNGNCFFDYTANKTIPNFSHHKLTTFEYADGANNVSINDAFNDYSTDRSDLDMYYEKIGLAYGASTGREIPRDFPSASIDVQTRIDEYRIVGSRGKEIAITNIKAGDGLGGGTRTDITVTLAGTTDGLDVDTPIRIDVIGDAEFNGQFVVKEVLSDTEIVYAVPVAPTNSQIISPSGTLNIAVDTVTSASPYIFNCSLRSVFGLCGLHADGNLVSGFKSMVVAQFTGISLQKDENAFIKYDETTGSYVDKTGVDNIISDSKSKYKSTYENYHIKASNNAFIQCVSIFAIGYANHFLADSGGDMSITNSNSNFGARSLLSKGYRADKFLRDDQGYIAGIIPPKHIESKLVSLEFNSIDFAKTNTVGNSSRLYLYNEVNENIPPQNVIEGYRIGAKRNDQLNVILSNAGISTVFSADVVMDGTLLTPSSYQKEYDVAKGVNGITNNINNNIITLTQTHDIENGEKIRVVSETGELPDGIVPDLVYYAITNTTAVGLGNTQLKLAFTLNDAENGVDPTAAVTINTRRNVNLKVVSRVSDKNSGDIGHPIQYDETQNNWYIKTNANSDIYAQRNNYSPVSPRTYIERTPDNRSSEDTVYKLRFVIPKNSPVKARPPLDGFVIQDSTSNPGSSAEINKQYSPDGAQKTLTNVSDLRNTTFIASASWNSNLATIRTELPHKLSAGSHVNIFNIISSNNTLGLSTSGFNGSYTVNSILNRKEFTYALTTNPGTYIDTSSTRTTSLPYFDRKEFAENYANYKSDLIQDYVQNEQDGIYHISVTNNSNNPLSAEFSDYNISQPIQNFYPQIDRDNVISDPDASLTYASSEMIGLSYLNDKQKSLTKETLQKFLKDDNIGFGLTDITSNVAGTNHVLYTNLDHNLNSITNLTIVAGLAGTGYGSDLTSQELYNAQLTGGSGEGATAVVVTDGIDGSINGIQVIDGGSGYVVGDVLSVVGIATTSAGTGFSTPARVEVTNINDAVGKVIEVNGISESYNRYNTLYRVTGISSSTSISVTSADAISSPEVNGVGLSTVSNSYCNITGIVLTPTSYTYNNVTGNATVTFGSGHGLLVSDKVRVSGANSSLYNGDFLVSRVINTNSLILNVGKSDTSPSTGGTILIYPYGYSSKGGNNLFRNEGRLSYNFSGTRSNLSSASFAADTNINISNAVSLGFKIGDYLLVNNEIVRIKTTVLNNSVEVFRGILGTRASDHDTASIVRKIEVYPVELRRYSILRASGHTFEYIGFGPGNYSSAFPDRQDREISEQEELLSQALRLDGGINVYTGMNNDGDFYIGNKRVSSATGQENVFDTPVPTVRGEELVSETGSTASSNIYQIKSITVDDSIRVDGGKNQNIISEFNGPVIFNKRVTSNSERGIETRHLFVQGNAKVSRKYTVGIATPSLAGNTGDVEYYSEPSDGGYLGWVYTTNNAWRKFAPVQNAAGEWVGTFNGNFVGLPSADSVWTEVSAGAGSSIAYYPDVPGVGNNRVGIGTSVVDSDTILKVEGKTLINGLLNVTEVVESATLVTTAWPIQNPGDLNFERENIYLGDDNVYYYTTNAQSDWIVNFTGTQAGGTLGSILDVGKSITVAILATIPSNGFYNKEIQIDGTTFPVRYYGGTQFVAGNPNSVDVYTYIIIRTSNTGSVINQYSVFASLSTYGN